MMTHEQALESKNIHVQALARFMGIVSHDVELPWDRIRYGTHPLWFTAIVIPFLGKYYVLAGKGRTGGISPAILCLEHGVALAFQEAGHICQYERIRFFGSVTPAVTQWLFLWFGLRYVFRRSFRVGIEREADGFAKDHGYGIHLENYRYWWMLMGSNWTRRYGRRNYGADIRVGKILTWMGFLPIYHTKLMQMSRHYCIERYKHLYPAGASIKTQRQARGPLPGGRPPTP